MEADDWSAILTGASVVVAIVAAVIAGLQARRARQSLRYAHEQAEAAKVQAHHASGSATSASKSADAAMDQAGSARKQVAIMMAQMAVDRLQRVREIHNEARVVVEDIERTVRPEGAAWSGTMPNASFGKKAQPHVITLRRLVERLRDYGVTEVAQHYEQVHRFAQAVVGLLIEADRPGGMPTAEVPAYIERYDELVLNMQKAAAGAQKSWAVWRDELEAARAKP